MKYLVFIHLFLSYAFAAKPLALIYNGRGACKKNMLSSLRSCANSAADVVKSIGFDVKYIDHTYVENQLFEQAQVWIQPGGKARVQNKYMNPTLKKNIQNFVNNGGLYIGFCAGMFLAGERLSWRGYSADGLGLLDKKMALYRLENRDKTSIITFSIDGHLRSMYWRLGPFFLYNPRDDRNAYLHSYYPPNSKVCIGEQHCVAMIAKRVGRGGIFLTGFHPEADDSWVKHAKLTDIDGRDVDYISSMILDFYRYIKKNEIE